MFLPGFIGLAPVIPGSQGFTASGNFTVPARYNALTVNIWGGGGAGGRGGGGDGGTGGPGGLSRFGSAGGPTANGGSGGQAEGGSGGAGGTASGGDTNTSGQNGGVGQRWYGGSSPFGGGQSGPSVDGYVPGGGGGGGDDSNDGHKGGGGGGGAFCQKTYYPGQLTPLSTIAVTVGLGGTVSGGNGGLGARGQVDVYWS